MCSPWAVAVSMLKANTTMIMMRWPRPIVELRMYEMVGESTKDPWRPEQTLCININRGGFACLQVTFKVGAVDFFEILP